MYENARREVNWEGNSPPGVIFHAASFDDSGNIRVADIWESEDQWKNFLNTHRMHYMQKAKALPLKMKIFQIHNINALSDLTAIKSVNILDIGGREPASEKADELRSWVQIPHRLGMHLKWKKGN